MGGHGVVKPEELQNVPSDILERYVRARLLATASNSVVGQRLGLPKETVRQAFAYVLADNSGHIQRLVSSPRSSGGSLQLTFGHSCQNLGCNTASCLLCAQNPNRRCNRTFSPKYLAGDVLKAHCGASIKVSVEDRCTLEPAEPDKLSDINLEVCILDGKAYEALQNVQREHDEAEVEKCILPTNNQGKELLMPTRGAYHNSEKWVVIPLRDGHAYLPDLTVTGSSEALLSGQKPPFRLLVRAMNAQDGTRAKQIRFVVSDDFVVATPRVRTAAKADIPHLDDHVSKLHSIGNMTQTKLQDIQAAALAVGVHKINVPYNTVTKVGQFKELVDMAEQDPQLCETLKKVLKLTRGWEIARDHARTAVVTDNKMRVWTPKISGSDLNMTGLLFRCQLGSADLDTPVGLLTPKKVGEGQPIVMEPTLIEKLPPIEKDSVKKLLKQAISSWWEDGHPGWSIWPIDSDRFLQELTGVSNGVLTTEHLITTTFTQPETRPVTRASALAQQTLENKPLQASSQSSSERASQEHVINSQGGPSQVQDWNFPSLQQNPKTHSSLRPSNYGPQSAQNTSNIFRQDPGVGSQGGIPLGNKEELGSFANRDPNRYANWGQSFPAIPTQQMNGGDLNHRTDWNGDFRMREAGNANEFSMPYNQGNNLHGYQDANSFGHMNNFGPPSMQFQDPFVPQNNFAPSLQPGLWNFQDGELNHVGQKVNQSMPPLPNLPKSDSFNRIRPNLSGNARKRDSDPPSLTSSGVLDSTSNPLPSPFGTPHMQDAEILPKPQTLPNPSAQMMNTRQSSGMEPSSAKRRHLSPLALQQGLSHIFGQPLDIQDMSKLIPQFSDLLDNPFSSKDLPSMPLAAHNLPHLMDSMLDHKQHNAQLQAVLEGDMGQNSDQQTPAQRLANALPNSLQGIDFTYGDLSEAVDLASKEPQQRGNGLTEQRNSQLLAEYLTSRAQPLSNTVSPRGENLNFARPKYQDGPIISEQRKSGLDTMTDIHEALP